MQRPVAKGKDLAAHAVLATLAASAMVILLAAPPAWGMGSVPLLGSRYFVVPGTRPLVVTQSGLVGAAAPADSFALYGSPGTLTGKFQTAAGQPDRQGWTGVDLTPTTPGQTVGEFSKVRALATDLDPCLDNTSPALCFVDDGTPPSNFPSQSTGGELSPTWAYGIPGAWVVNYTSGVASAGGGIHNEAWSPEIAYDLPTTADDASVGGLTLRYDIWEHLPLRHGLFHTWRVRSFPDPTSGGWSSWRDRGFVYYGDTGAWSTRQIEVGDLLVAAPTKVQIALGVVDLSAALGLAGSDAAPAPFFDNVRVLKHAVAGPVITTREIDLLHEGFPRSGAAISSSNLADFSLRLDMAQDIFHARGPVLTGDSMVVRVTPTLPGTTLTPAPLMTWYLRPNPLFDGVRQLPSSAQSVPNGYKGTVMGTRVRNVAGQIAPNLYWFDLPDGAARNPDQLPEPDEPAMFFPGDKLWCFVEAHDSAGNTSLWLRDPNDHEIPNGTLCGGTSPLTAETQKVPKPEPLPQPKEPDPDGLPGIWEGGVSMSELGAGALATAHVQPRILVWDDASAVEERQSLELALAQNGVLAGRDYDIFSTLAPECGLGNGLGAAGAHGAFAEQLEPYDLLIYVGGDAGAPLISDGSGNGLNDESADVALLNSWHAQPHNRAAIYFAGHIASAMTQQGSATSQYVSDVQGVDLLADDLRPLVLGQSDPDVAPSGGVSGFAARLVAAGGCAPWLRFDGIRPRSGSGAVAAHSFLTPSGAPIAGVAASIWFDRFSVVGGSTFRRTDVTFPYGFAAIADDHAHLGPPGDGRSARARLLGELLVALGHPVHPPDATPAPPGTPPVSTRLQVGLPQPNPFNPATTLWLQIPTPRPVFARVVDVRGRLVRALMAGELCQGACALRWDGADTAGRPVAGGAYFVEVESLGQREIRRLALVK